MNIVVLNPALRRGVFLVLSRKWQISTDGGVYPQWRADSKESVYQKLDGTITAVEVTAKGDSLEVESPESLFETTPPVAGVILEPLIPARKS